PSELLGGPRRVRNALQRGELRQVLYIGAIPPTFKQRTRARARLFPQALQQLEQEPDTRPVQAGDRRSVRRTGRDLRVMHQQVVCLADRASAAPTGSASGGVAAALAVSFRGRGVAGVLEAGLDLLGVAGDVLCDLGDERDALAVEATLQPMVVLAFG